MCLFLKLEKKVFTAMKAAFNSNKLMCNSCLMYDQCPPAFLFVSGQYAPHPVPDLSVCNNVSTGFLTIEQKLE